jgi:cell division protein FtsQ
MSEEVTGPELEGAEEEQQEEYGRHVYVLFGILAIMLLAGFTVKSQWQEHVPIRQVRVEGMNIVTRDEVMRLLNLPPRSTLYSLDLTQLQRNILGNSFVKSATIKRDVPATLVVEIEERIPAAMLLRGNAIFSIDEEGVILPYLQTRVTYDLPLITGIDSAVVLKPGIVQTQKELVAAMEIIKVSKLIGDELYHSISEIHLRAGGDIILYSFDNGIPIIFGHGDAVRKMLVFEEYRKKFLQHTNREGIQYIDLRFEDQIVVADKNS